MGAPQIHHADGTLCLATDGDLGVTLVRRPLTIAQIEPLRRVARAQARQYHNSSRMLTVIEASGLSATIPDEVRREMESLMTEVPSLAVAVVIEGTGFGAATLRTLLSGIALLRRMPTKMKIFAAATDAARWLAEATTASPQGPLRSTAAADLLEAARAAIDAPAR